MWGLGISQNYSSSIPLDALEGGPYSIAPHSGPSPPFTPLPNLQELPNLELAAANTISAIFMSDWESFR